MEEEGIPTTQISLIREHTEAIRPPRALWVPFELGRPLGAPGSPGFQRRVLLAALELLVAPAGPLLEDFPDEAPEDAAGEDEGLKGWSCPVGFVPEWREGTDLERLRAAFEREVAELRPWYDLYLERHDRTAVVTFGPESASGFIGGFATGENPVIPEADLSFAAALRLAAQDLKSFYFEAATARPGSASPNVGEFNEWFWNHSAGGRILKAAKERCLEQDDESIRKIGASLLIPMDQT